MRRFSFAKDIVKGMGYLADNGMNHGRLKSNNCVIDDRWTAKIVGKRTGENLGVYHSRMKGKVMFKLIT